MSTGRLIHPLNIGGFMAVVMFVLASVIPSLTLAERCTLNRQSPIAESVQPFIDSHSLAGAVMLVADKTRILDLTAVGFSDITANKPMPTNALFWIASESKPITATAFMMLVDEGKIHLDDPVAKYLPEFGNLWVKVESSDDRLLLKRPGHAITCREILSHTSGLPPVSPIERPTFDLMPLRDAVASHSMNPLSFEPGTKYEYSNAGINTAGRIIEVVSGMPYERFLEEKLFKPLGMKDTTFWPNRRQVSLLAKSYKPNAAKTGLEETTISQVKYPLDGPGRYPFPAGGLFSTATDICRFCQMILNGGVAGGKRLISEAAIHEMTRKQTPSTINVPYGLGWGAGDTFGHGGAYATNLQIDSKRGLIYVWMVQQAGFPNNGGESFGAFQSAALKQFGNNH